MRRLVALVLVACVTPVWSQGLAEVAAREKKRREAQTKATSGKPVRSYGDDDLKGRAPDGNDKAAKPTDRPSNTDTPSGADFAPSGNAAEDSKRQLAESIRVRLLNCRDEVTGARERLKSLESALANLQPHPYYNMEAVRQELERVVKDAKATIETMGRRCDDIEDEARRANIPAGWIR